MSEGDKAEDKNGEKNGQKLAEKIAPTIRDFARGGEVNDRRRGKLAKWLENQWGRQWACTLVGPKNCQKIG